MANTDFPHGLEPAYHLLGGAIRTLDFTLTTGETVYKGDLIKGVAGGTVQASAAGDGTIVVGVAAAHVDDSGSAGGKTVPVYTDPFIVYAIQADGSNVAADVFATADHVAGAGSSTTGISGHELDSSDTGTGAQLKIIGKVDRPDNAWGTNVDLLVLINEHAFKAAVAGF